MTLHRHHSQTLSRVLACVCAAALAPTALAGEETPRAGEKAGAKTLATRLVALRSEVEALSADLTLVRAQAKEDLRRHAEQTRDVESEIAKENLRLVRVQDAAARLQTTTSTTEQSAASLTPAVLAAAAQLRAYVVASLPYRKDARLAAVDTLVQEVDTGTVTAAVAAPRLYALIQDERRLTEDSERVRETVTIGGETLLVDAVRLGMTTLFFRADDGRTGRLVRSTGSTSEPYVVELLQTKEHQAQVAALLDAFGKQIRTGWFEIPLAIPPRTSSVADLPQGRAQ